MHNFVSLFNFVLVIQGFHSHGHNTHIDPQSLVFSNNAPQSTRSPRHCAQHGETKSHSTNREKLTATTRVLPTLSACANITTRRLLWRHCC